MATVDSIVLKAQKREANGSGAARRARMDGWVPIVVYGEGRQENLQVNTHDFTLMLHRHGEHQILDLVVEDAAPVKVLIKDVQHHVVDGNILHADLVAVSMTKPIEISLPIHLEGEAVGLKTGGVLETVVNELAIACLPGDVVEEISVDVSGLDVGDSLTAGDVQMPSGITLLEEPETVIVTMAYPTVETEPSSEEEAEADATAEGAAESEEEKEE